MNAISATTANAIWSASSTTSMYEIQYAVTGSGNWINAGLVAAPQTTYLINGLQPNTSYQVRVRGCVT
ncbi:MAG: fibronectin type III domain-containing protein [Bacteroidota bacterium]|nr:MAG: fibronectin type III domain-containing protein [Bacteroidota bacterium]